MRIAFVDNLPVGGGLSRFSLCLCKSLVENNSAVEIDYFVHSSNLKHIPEVQNLGNRVNVHVLKSSKLKSLPYRVIQKIANKFGLMEHDEESDIKEIESRIDRQYSLAYFPSAHMMKRPNLPIPVVGTIHDFNWRYFFGREIFSRSFMNMMDVEVLSWMNRGYTICSSHDVVDEARKLYPQAERYPQVVHIGPVVIHKDLAEDRATEILKSLKIDFPYIIFPGNFFPHKNHLNLFTAFYLLRKRKGFENYKLILTGMNSDRIKRGIAERRGVQVLTEQNSSTDFDIMGMGYQPNEVIDALISKAKLLVSPSIYEAICTPGMDAWNFGTPTAISDIPPFREHEKVWGVKSAYFDPMNPEDIANVIEAYLSDPEKAKTDGKLSKANMANYTWEHVASGYMDVFEKAIQVK